MNNTNKIAAPCVFDYVCDNDGATIRHVLPKRPLGDFSVPSTLGGMPVTVLDKELFYGVKSLAGVTIPDSVTTIESSVFAGCSSLTDLSVPDRFLHLVDDLTCNIELEDDPEVDLEVG